MSSDVSVRSGDKNSHVYCCSLVLISYLIQNQVVETSHMSETISMPSA